LPGKGVVARRPVVVMVGEVHRCGDGQPWSLTTDAGGMGAQGQEEDPMLHRDVMTTRSPRPSLQRWRVVGSVFAVLASTPLAILVTRSMAYTRTVSEARDTIVAQEQAAVYAQCGGNGITKDCLPGCVCNPKNDFFWWCLPMEGQSVCNVGVAKDLLAKATDSMLSLKAKATQAAKARKDAEAAFKDATSASSNKTADAHRAALNAKAAAEEADMTILKKEHLDNVTSVTKAWKGAKDHLTETQTTAEAQAQQKIKDAEVAIKQKKEMLE